MGLKYLDLKELVYESDIISVHVPFNDSNVDLKDEKELNLMKENTILINCARGPIGNSDSLAEALNNKKIDARYC